MASIGAIGIVAASSLFYETELPQHLLQALAAFALTAALFASIGVFLGSLLPTSRAAQGAGLLLFFVMMFISGAGPPREVLSDEMQAFSNALPLTHAIVLLQDSWLGYGWNWTASLVMSGMLAGTAVLSLRLFRWE
jgi:ABC-2 type transport system permease protein